MFTVLICGDRDWADGDMVLADVRRLRDLHDDELTVIQGGAKGADRWAAHACRLTGVRCVEVPAEWQRFGRAAGPIRNQKMLDMTPDEVIAFHDDLEKSKGTKDMVRRAKNAGVPVTVRFHERT